MPIAIKELQKKYFQKLDSLDIELLLANAIKKTREFILAHPEKELTALQAKKFESLAKRRLKHEPLAYILGHKEFYGLDFEVTPATLIPRPETEMLVEEASELLRSLLRNKKRTTIIDVGTGSGNIIISLAKKTDSLCHYHACGNPVAHSKISTLNSSIHGNDKFNFFGLDISRQALAVAKRNAKKNNSSEIKFIQSDLLSIFLENNLAIKHFENLIILANLPYLSKKVYSTIAPNVKKFEPRSALYSANEGLAHYEKLFKQIALLHKICKKLNVILEFSPEQKPALQKLIKKHFRTLEPIFKKDLAGKWRMASFTL